MKTIGIFTVGGSTVPIINSIIEEKFDFVYFICSSGKSDVASERLVDGKPLKEGDKIIAKECNLSKEDYEKITLDVDIIDDLNETFKKLEEDLLSRLNERFPDKQSIRVIANYTGGTKTMSAALVILSILQDGWELQLNTAQRTNLIKIDSGDFPTSINKINLLYRIDRKYFDTLMHKYYYEEIIEKAKNYLKASLPVETKNEIMRLKDILNAFVLWDKFHHQSAFEEFDRIIKALPKDSSCHKAIINYYLCLKQILGKKSCHGYEKVIDLVMNAERRAEQSKFDDSIARYYRAIEMIAQLRLNSHGIDNSNIKCNELPKLNEKALQFLQTECEKNSEDGIVKLALAKSYELLAHMDDDLGKLYLERKKELLECLKLRNNSILAHGLEPVLKEKFEQVKSTFKSFIQEALKIAAGTDLESLRQFPRSLRDIGF
ncbi:TIGR02710 family CRISPR-associated CARF protein [Thermodesulfovibrio sp. 3907-1M]|uniref:TIGR02710 family CRISPR-associated CARF protein n=1 Tax=Thermodesulfovibrio autotrophicus TaxID=3118333 RepID=A0AAU8GV62_9BACT